MAFRVDLAKSAETDLEELYLWILGRAPHQGATWFNGLERAILALDQHPDRRPLAREQVDPERPIRILNYGRRSGVYQVFFAVDHVAKIVRILHIRRGTGR